jgi:hypothetical protein
LFEREGLFPAHITRILATTVLYDHCNMTAGPAAENVDHFRQCLLEMSYEDPEVRPLFDLEGLTRWREARESGYSELEAAVDQFGLYDQSGKIMRSS